MQDSDPANRIINNENTSALSGYQRWMFGGRKTDLIIAARERKNGLQIGLDVEEIDLPRIALPVRRLL